MFNQLLHLPGDKELFDEHGGSRGGLDCVRLPQINAASLLEPTMKLFCRPMLSSSSGSPLIKLIVELCQQLNSWSLLAPFLYAGTEHNMCYN